MSETHRFDLTTLASICPLPSGLQQCWTESASVMLSKRHSSPALTELLRDGEAATAVLIWSAAAPQMADGYGYMRETIADGAYAVATVAVHVMDRYVVKRRLHQGSGADLYMVREGDPEEEFVKLEVSGSDADESLGGRLNKKVNQARGGNISRPSVAVVVGYIRPQVRMQRSR